MAEPSTSSDPISIHAVIPNALERGGTETTDAPVDKTIELLLVKVSRTSVQTDERLSLLAAPGRCEARPEGLWFAPAPRERWLLARPSDVVVALGELHYMFSGMTTTIVDMGDAVAFLDVEGEDCHAVLAAGCGLSAGVPAGHATRTRMANIQVTLVAPPQGGLLRIIVDRSHVDYLKAWLKTVGVHVGSDGG